MAHKNVYKFSWLEFSVLHGLIEKIQLKTWYSTKSFEKWLPLRKDPEFLGKSLLPSQ